MRLWAEIAPPARRGLFRAKRAQARGRFREDLELLLDRLGALVRHRELADASEVAAAATDVARWAEESNLLVTALEFAEAAALADPGSPVTASLAGRLARRTGEGKRSAAWYRRAIALAGGDRDAYIRSQLGYGGVMMEIGKLAEAKRALRRASRVAIKYGRRGLAAQANHDLLVIACSGGTYEDGAVAAERALERYSIRHPRLPHLALDYGILLVRNGYFAAAIPLLQRLVNVVNHDSLAVVYGMLARCAGGVGDRELFERTCEEVLRRVESPDRFGAKALVHAAIGAQSLERWSVAERLGEAALSAARSLGDESTAVDAGRVLDAVLVRAGGDREAERGTTLQVQLTVAMFLRRLEKLSSV